MYNVLTPEKIPLLNEILFVFHRLLYPKRATLLMVYTAHLQNTRIDHDFCTVCIYININSRCVVVVLEGSVSRRFRCVQFRLLIQLSTNLRKSKLNTPEDVSWDFAETSRNFFFQLLHCFMYKMCWWWCYKMRCNAMPRSVLLIIIH